MKKIIKVTEVVDLVELFVHNSDSISEAITSLTNLAANYNSSARFRIESVGYDGAYDWHVEYDRLENDEEYKLRLMEETKIEIATKAKEETERKELARLQKKYGIQT